MELVLCFFLCRDKCLWEHWGKSYCLWWFLPNLRSHIGNCITQVILSLSGCWTAWHICCSAVTACWGTVGLSVRPSPSGLWSDYPAVIMNIYTSKLERVGTGICKWNCWPVKWWALSAQYEHNYSAPCGWLFYQMPSTHNNLSCWWCFAQSSYGSTKCAYSPVLTRTHGVITRCCSLFICHTVATLFHHPPATTQTSQQPLPCFRPRGDGTGSDRAGRAGNCNPLHKYRTGAFYSQWPNQRSPFSTEVWNNPRHAMHTNGCLTRVVPGNCKLASWCIRDSWPFEGMKWHCTASGCPNVLHWETEREGKKGRERHRKRGREVTLNSQLASAWSGGGVRATVGTIMAWTDNINHNQF